MNFLKKKLKPLTAGFNQASSAANQNNTNKDLEDDLYDEYVVEAPPHPSELLALGVEPSEIDVNDPDKLRELYRKAKEEGKDKKTNSVLLARQRQKEEIEEKKRTREEWKFFDSLTSRVEQVVKESQKNLDHWKESSAVCELTEPEYELRQTPDEVFRPVTTVKAEKGANEWIDFDDEKKSNQNDKKTKQESEGEREAEEGEELDEFGCPRRRQSSSANKPSDFVVEELLEDFGIDLRTAEQRKKLELKRAKEEEEERKRKSASPAETKQETNEAAKSEVKVAPRPRPRPKSAQQEERKPEAPAASNQEAATAAAAEQEIDPFQTSFVADEFTTHLDENQNKVEAKPSAEAPVAPKVIDPFDTSYVNLE